MSEFVQVARTSEIAEGSAVCVEVEGRQIAVFNLGGEFHAIDDECTHEGGPLSEGIVEGGEIECPWHGARFDIRTGEVRGEPAEENVRRYEVRVVGDAIEVRV